MKKVNFAFLLFLISVFSFSQIEQADLYFDKGEYYHAVKYYKAALQDNPDDIQLLSRIIDCHTKLYWDKKQHYLWVNAEDSIAKKNLEQALYYSHQVFSLDDTHKNTLAVVANLHYINKNIPEALFYAEKYRNIYKEDQEDISYLMENMYQNLITYFIDVSETLEEKEKYINKLPGIENQFNYLYVEHLIEKNDIAQLDSYLRNLIDRKESINYQHLINRCLKFNKDKLAIAYLIKKYEADGKRISKKESENYIKLVKNKFNEIARYFKNINQQNYKNYMLNPQQKLSPEDIKLLQSITYDDIQVYMKGNEIQIVVDSRNRNPDMILYGLYNEPEMYEYSLQILDTSDGYKIQIFD